MSQKLKPFKLVLITFPSNVFDVVNCRGNYGAHTLRLIEYLAANRDTFDWTENDMPTIQEKMAVEVFVNSKEWVRR